MKQIQSDMQIVSKFWIIIDPSIRESVENNNKICNDSKLIANELKRFKVC